MDHNGGITITISLIGTYIATHIATHIGTHRDPHNETDWPACESTDAPAFLVSLIYIAFIATYIGTHREPHNETDWPAFESTDAPALVSSDQPADTAAYRSTNVTAHATPILPSDDNSNSSTNAPADGQTNTAAFAKADVLSEANSVPYDGPHSTTDDVGAADPDRAEFPGRHLCVRRAHMLPAVGPGLPRTRHQPVSSASSSRPKRL